MSDDTAALIRRHNLGEPVQHSLVTQLCRVEAELAEARKELWNTISAMADLCAENVELKKDTARLDWLDSDGEAASDYCGHYWREWLVSTINSSLPHNASVRAAIDAAMEAKQ